MEELKINNEEEKTISKSDAKILLDLILEADGMASDWNSGGYKWLDCAQSQAVNRLSILVCGDKLID